MPAKSATRKQIAAAAGVSVATVSYVLNDSPEAARISERTKQAVRQAAKAVNYRPNPIARALSTGRSQRIGVLAARTPFVQVQTEVIFELDGTLRNAGYQIALTFYRDRASLLSAHQGLLQSMVDGIILIGPVTGLDDRDVRRMQSLSPLLLLDHASRCRKIASIEIDHSRGGVRAVDYIRERGLDGPVAFVGCRSMPESGKIQTGIDGALAASGRPPVADGSRCHLLESYDPTTVIAEGIAAAAALLRAKRPPRVVVTCHDLLATAVVAGLRDHGLSVPADCGVIGYGDNPQICEVVSPTLTTLRIPMYGIGASAGEMMVRLIAGTLPSAERCQVRTPRVIARQSC